ncbi:MAG: MarR family winged helix-turn-helix transcriptional regulator, partial [Acidimicrobiales bacterium]
STPTPPRNQTKVLSDRLADAVLTDSRVLVAVAARSLSEHESEVSLPQYRTLVVLGSRGPQRIVDLAQALGVDPSTATRMCDRLVRKRLITRRRDIVDRRGVTLDLSAAGQRLVTRVAQRRRREIARILAMVDPAEYENLVRAFTTFGDAAGEVPEDSWHRSWEL